MARMQAAPDGLKGFDTADVVSATAAEAMVGAGYQFVARYVRRTTPHPSDLSVDEVAVLHAAGLAVTIVQHVESESSWVPSEEKGETYGKGALAACTELQIPAGVTVWLDLEGVAPGTAPKEVAAYCRAWADIIAAGGYSPGLYVGWHAGLGANQLYALPFEHYWAAYNLNQDEYPATRGVQMKQHAATEDAVPDGVSLTIDTDHIAADSKGGVPMLYVADDWTGDAQG